MLPHFYDHLWSFRDPGWDPSILPGWDGSLTSEGLRMTFYVFLVTMTSLTMHDLIKYAWRFKYFWGFLRPFKPFLTLWAPLFRSLTLEPPSLFVKRLHPRGGVVSTQQEKCYFFHSKWHYHTLFLCFEYIYTPLMAFKPKITLKNGSLKFLLGF